MLTRLDPIQRWPHRRWAALRPDRRAPERAAHPGLVSVRNRSTTLPQAVKPRLTAAVRALSLAPSTATHSLLLRRQTSRHDPRSSCARNAAAQAGSPAGPHPRLLGFESNRQCASCCRNGDKAAVMLLDEQRCSRIECERSSGLVRWCVAMLRGIRGGGASRGRVLAGLLAGRRRSVPRCSSGHRE